MFYKPDGRDELSQAELDAVRSGFTGLLAKRRFHPEFVSKHADDLLATAHAEYVRYSGKGVEIEDPVAWMIHCAWRRLQNLLSASNCRPADLSSEVLAELVDEATPTPAQIAEDVDRVRKVHHAIAKLDLPQRQVVALMYFEDMPLAEAARRLGWHESKARRCHEAAMKRLRRSLAVKSSDQLAPEIGLAAWLSFSGASPAFHLPTGFEAAIDKASEGASGLWARTHDLARRFALGGGSDAASAMSVSGAGRTAGACATIAVACIVGASGIVGPGIGRSPDLRSDPHTRSVRSRIFTGTLRERATATQHQDTRSASASTGQTNQATGDRKTTSSEGGDSVPRRTAEQQVAEQTDGLARAESESSASALESTSGGSTTSRSETQTRQQFNAFR